MKKTLGASGTILILSLMMPHSCPAQIGHNIIGIYTTEVPDFQDLEADATVTGSFLEFFDLYVVCSIPHNEAGAHPISTVGGFEFRIDWDDHSMAVTYFFSGTNSATYPDLQVSTALPVMNETVTLMSIEIISGTGNPLGFHITPISDAGSQQIPGAICVVDADDILNPLCRAYPSSGSFGEPVFGFNLEVVPNDAASWGELKALYR